MHACDSANLEIVRLLLDNGANPKTKKGTCTFKNYMYMYVYSVQCSDTVWVYGMCHYTPFVDWYGIK